MDSIVYETGAHVPCGLTKHFSPNADPNGADRWANSVGNCHTYGVMRAIVYTDGSVGACRGYGEHRARTGVTEREPSHLIGC